MKIYFRVKLMFQTPVQNFGSVDAGKVSKTGGIISSGWCRAVNNHHCSSDKTETLKKLISRKRKGGKQGNNNLHHYVEGSAYLYTSPAIKNQPRACFLSLESEE